MRKFDSSRWVQYILQVSRRWLARQVSSFFEISKNHSICGYGSNFKLVVELRSRSLFLAYFGSFRCKLYSSVMSNAYLTCRAFYKNYAPDHTASFLFYSILGHNVTTHSPAFSYIRSALLYDRVYTL